MTDTRSPRLRIRIYKRRLILLVSQDKMNQGPSTSCRCPRRAYTQGCAEGQEADIAGAWSLLRSAHLIL